MLIERLNRWINAPKRRFRKYLIVDYCIHWVNKTNYFLGLSTKHSVCQFDYYKCLFIHIPKSGGISILHSLFKNKGNGHYPLKWYKDAYPKHRLNSFYTFTFVRNPWARLYSAYIFLKKGGLNNNDRDFFERELSNYKNFEDFVYKWLTPQNIYKYVHFVPQFEYLVNENGELAIDFIGRTENIEEDFAKVITKIAPKKSMTLIKLNQSTKHTTSYQKEYTPKMIEIVASVYARDIKLFNYTFA